MPGLGISVKLFSLEGDRHLVASAVTNADGRTDDPLFLQTPFFDTGVAWYRADDDDGVAVTGIPLVAPAIHIALGRFIVCRNYPCGSLVLQAYNQRPVNRL